MTAPLLVIGGTGNIGSRVVPLLRDAGVRHLVLISVIGADRMPIGYFRAKAVAERAIAGLGHPVDGAPGPQLHDFALPVARSMARMPLLPVPGGLRFEPVHGDEVAARLDELALGAPAGRIGDLAGPEVLDVTQLVSTFLEVSGGGTWREYLEQRERVAARP